MSPFEYISVLISIVLGLGITQIVAGIAEVIHHWNRVKLYWPHLLWIVLVFFLHFQEWWWLYELRDHERWRLPVVLFIILYPVDLFILARVLFPFSQQDSSTEPVDMRAFYFRDARKFFLLIAILALLAILDDVFLQDYRLVDEFVQVSILLASSFIAWRRIENERVHQVFVVVLVLVMLATFAVQWNNWLVGLP